MDSQRLVLFCCSAFFLFSTPESFAQPPASHPPAWPRAIQNFPGPVAFKHRLLARQIQQAQVDQPRASKPQKPECPPKCDELVAKAKKNGSVRVIVGLNVSGLPDPIQLPEKERSKALQDRKKMVAEAQDRMLSRLAKHKIRSVKKASYGPDLAMSVDSLALEALIADPDVLSIGEDKIHFPTLNQTVPLIGADQAWASGFDATGYLIAVLDTGVDSSHSFLSGKVVGESCFSTIDSGPGWNASSLCPNGSSSQTGAGAAVPCGPPGCEHGTHVAGIAAGNSSSISGVAKSANLMAAQVFTLFSGTVCPTSSPCLGSLTFDQVLALEWVLDWALGDPNGIAAVNMSVGGGQYTEACDNVSDYTALKARIDQLRTFRIATVISSGNNSCSGTGCNNAISGPACISTAISVGATTKSDTVPSYSNSASFLNLLAPGGDSSGGSGDIYSSVPGGGFAPSAGTSMAAPHVAGAFAVLRHQSPSATVDDIFQTLRTTGVRITDPRNDVTIPRIRLRETPWIASFQHLYPTGMSLDAARNAYVVGEYRAGEAIYTGVLKYSTDGRLLWSAVYDDDNPETGTSPDIGASVVDPSGNVYVGASQETGETCASPGPPCVWSTLRTLKYDTSGNLLWASNLTIGIDAHPTAVTVDAQGYVYVASDHCFAGHLFCTARGSLVMKFDPGGAMIWNTSYYDSFPITLAVDSAGSIVMAACQGSSSYSPSVKKFDANGVLLWSHEPGGEGCISAIFVDAENNIYATGDSNGSYLTVKYDPAGNLLWWSSYGVGIAASIDSDGQGAIYVTGGSNGSLPETRSYGTVKYDVNGNQIWAREYSTPVTSGYVFAEKVKTDTAGNVFVNGTVEDTATYPSKVRVVTLKYDASGNELWRMDRAGVQSGLAMDIDIANNLYMTAVRMNPSSPTEAVTIKYAAP